ncbi:hypothetical protein LAZ67_5002782 [Cordylochernes scorpioides]|uniref:Uncharacterized protein n=1 Tax=Cordylochernes scorpioides TaxID=51811 RepID=A0ABY6KLH7_9ARAC|nr:hypothetical protein LAZ67_5002782 [Cordylochernes scorpioides]
MFNSIPPEQKKKQYNSFPDVQKARQLTFSRTQLKHERDEQRYDKGHQAPHFEECVINEEAIDADEDQRKYEKTKIKQEKALATIALSISTEQQIHVIDCKTASEVWTTLEQIFEPKSRARILQLKKQFVNIKFIEEENMINYLSRFKTCSDNLREAGCEVKDEDLAYSMLAGLPDSYDGIIMNFSNMTDD